MIQNRPSINIPDTTGMAPLRIYNTLPHYRISGNIRRWNQQVSARVWKPYKSDSPHPRCRTRGRTEGKPLSSHEHHLPPPKPTTPVAMRNKSCNPSPRIKTERQTGIRTITFSSAYFLINHYDFDAVFFGLKSRKHIS